MAKGFGETGQGLAPALYMVATPIGNARDITLRALDALAGADVLAAEDTRMARRLMEIHGIPLGDRPLHAYHDHNGPAMRPKLLAALREGRSVAYVTDAGTPLVADPGYVLVREALAEGLAVEALPGASAVLAALAVAGLPSDRFLFAGFAPSKSSARRQFLESLRDVEATLVVFETPKRMQAFLNDAVTVVGADRPAAVCRELTKKFEEVHRMSLGEMAQMAESFVAKGECVVVIGRAEKGGELGEADIAALLSDALSRSSFKDAVREVTDRTGAPRRRVYQIGLGLGRDGPDDGEGE